MNNGSRSSANERETASIVYMYSNLLSLGLVNVGVASVFTPPCKLLGSLAQIRQDIGVLHFTVLVLMSLTRYTLHNLYNVDRKEWNDWFEEWTWLIDPHTALQSRTGYHWLGTDQIWPLWHYESIDQKESLDYYNIIQCSHIFSSSVSEYTSNLLLSISYLLLT